MLLMSFISVFNEGAGNDFPMAHRHVWHLSTIISHKRFQS